MKNRQLDRRISGLLFCGKQFRIRTENAPWLSLRLKVVKKKTEVALCITEGSKKSHCVPSLKRQRFYIINPEKRNGGKVYEEQKESCFSGCCTDFLCTVYWKLRELPVSCHSWKNISGISAYGYPVFQSDDSADAAIHLFKHYYWTAGGPFWYFQNGRNLSDSGNRRSGAESVCDRLYNHADCHDLIRSRMYDPEFQSGKDRILSVSNG